MLKNLSQILIGLSVFTPVIVAGQLFFPFISGKATLFRVLIELALFFYFLHILLSQNRKEKWDNLVKGLKNPIVISLTAFLLLFILSSITAVNPTQAFWSNFERSEGAFQLIHYYLFFLLVITLFKKRQDMEKLLLSLVISATYAATYGLLQWLTLDASFKIIGGGARISGTLGNASYLAALMLFAIGFLLYFIIRTKNKGIQILGTTLAMFFAVILFKTGTRGALLGLIIAGIVFLVANLFRKKSSKWLKNTSLVLIILGVVFSATFFITNKNEFWSKIPVVGRQLQLERAVDEFQPRLWSWDSAIQGFKDKPILGWGPENYPFVYDKYYDARNFGRESFFDRVHNLYLENLVSGGILLFLSALLVLVLLFKEIFKKKKDLWFAILLSIPIAYMVQAFFLFDVLVIYISFYLLIALALNKDVDSESSSPLKLGTVQTALILLASLLLLINTLFIHKGNLVIAILLFLAIVIFYRKNKEEYLVSPLDAISSLVALLFIAILLYTTAYKPLVKNKAITRTFSTNDIFQKTLYFKEALAVSSPIGQEETVGTLNTFLLNLTQQLEQNLSVPIEVLEDLVNTANNAHDENLHILPGLRHQYTNGGYNLRLGYLLQQPAIINRGKEIYYQALEEAPTRIEFLVLLIEVAKIDGNAKEYERLRNIAISLRPDLANSWPEL